MLYDWKIFFFRKQNGEIDYSNCYKTMSMPFSWYIVSFLNSYNVILDYIYLPIIDLSIITNVVQNHVWTTLIWTTLILDYISPKELKFRSEITCKTQLSIYLESCNITYIWYVTVCIILHQRKSKENLLNNPKLQLQTWPN